MLKMKLKTSCFAMSYLTNAERVRGQVDALKLPQSREPAYVEGGFKVSAVRLRGKRYESVKDYISDMSVYVSQAAQAGSQLICFPEFAGMLPLSLMPRFDSILTELRQIAREGGETARESYWMLFEASQGFVGEIYLNTMAELAKIYKIAIVGGGIYRIDNGQLYNRQYLFTPDGQVGGMQDKLFLSHYERKMGVTAGKRLTPASSPVGNVALLTAEATQHYEGFVIAAAMDCTVATLGASPYGGDTECARYRAQESGLCIISSGAKCTVRQFGFELDEPAMVLAPIVATKERGGIVKLEQEELVTTARVELIRAAEMFDPYSADRNTAFYKEMIKDAEVAT